MALRSMHPRAVSLALAAMLMTSALPAVAQDETEPAASLPVGGEASLPVAGLASILPGEVAGLPLEAQEFSMAALLEAADPEDPEAAPQIALLDEISQSLGVGFEQMTFGTAQAVDFDAGVGVSISSLQASGVDGEALVEPLFELMRLVYPTRFDTFEMVVQPGQLDGRDVYLVGMELLADDELGESDAVIVSVGDMTLFIQGDPDSIREIVAALP